jgi:hypothetical protein
LKAAGVLCIFVALGGWALASPVGASPDENFHLASIWCSHGERPGVCEPGDQAGSRQVPSVFPLEIVCYFGAPEQSAACQPEQVPGDLVSTDRGNFDGLYPPVFYWFAGLFVGDSIGASVLIMRMLNALLFVALVTAVYLLTPPGLRRPMIVGGLVTAVPLGVFLIPSINPSSWAIISAATFMVSLLGYVTAADRRRRIGLGAIAALSLLVGAGARADAAMYAVVACVAALVLVWRRDAGALRRLAYPAVLAVAATAVFLSTGQSEVAGPGAASEGLSLGRLMRAVVDVPALWIGGMGSPPSKYDYERSGTWGLGWLDTGMPSAVWASMWGVFVAVLFVALAAATRRRAVAVTVVGAAALLIPAYIQYASSLSGFIQPRYVLPLLMLVAITATVRPDGEAFRLAPGYRWAIVAIVSVANAVAMHTNLRRYVTGIDVIDWNLDRAPEWWWSIAISPLTVWVVSSLAFGVGAYLLTAELTTRANATGEASYVAATLALDESADGRPGSHRAPSGPEKTSGDQVG